MDFIGLTLNGGEHMRAHAINYNDGGARLQLGTPIWEGAESLRCDITIRFDGPGAQDKAMRLAVAINSIMAAPAVTPAARVAAE